MTTQNNADNAGTDYAELQRRLRAADYDPATTATLMWLLTEAEQNKWSMGRTAAEVGTSASTLSRVLRGGYAGRKENIIKLIAAYREKREARKTVAAVPFIETEMARKIWQAIDYSQTYGEIVSIIGNSQWGKTTAAEEYRRRKSAAGDDAVLYIRMPLNPTPSKLCAALLKELGLSPRGTVAACMEQLKATLSSRYIVIVDEAHQAATGTNTRGLQSIEFLRELYDVTHCALVLIGTNVWGRILDGKMLKEWAAILGQTVLRGINVTLPPRLGYTDEQAVWKSFGLPDPDADTYKVVQSITSVYGLGRYVKRMRAAATAANRSGVPFAWEHVMAVHEQLNQLAGLQ